MSAQPISNSFLFSSRDSQAELLQDAILSLTETKSEDPQVLQAILYGLGKPRYLNLALARKLLFDGNRVNRFGNVFFKREPIIPLVEQAVYQMSQLLGGEIVAPSRLIIIESPNPSGEMEISALQASLAIEGIDLESILRIPGYLHRLEQVFGHSEFIKHLPYLLSGKYNEEWLKKNHISSLPWEKQLDCLLDLLYSLAEQDRPLELTEGNPSRKKVEKILLDDKKFVGKNLLSLIALLEFCLKVNPKFCQNAYILELVYLPKLFEHLSMLYPEMHPEKILKEAQEIFHQFNKEHLSRHFILSLLTEPEDHKADNFIVPIKRGVDGKLLLNIVAIDNDRALQGVFRKKEKIREHQVEVKTVIYRLISMLDERLTKSIQEHLTSINPELFIYEWIASLACIYQAWMQNFPGLFPALVDSLHLKEQLSENCLARIRQRLQIIQSLSLNKTKMNEVFLTVEPILCRFYGEVAKHVPGVLNFIDELYEGQDIQHLSSSFATSLEKVLEGQLNDLLPGGRTLLQDLTSLDLSSPRYQSYQGLLEDFMKRGDLSSLEVGKSFIEKHKFFYPKLCLWLLYCNQPLAWNYSLHSISQETPNETAIYLEGLGGRRYLTQDTYQQIFSCNLYLLEFNDKTQPPLRRNAIILAQANPGFIARFTNNRTWITEKDKLYTISLPKLILPSFVRDKTGLIKMTEKNRDELQKIIKEILEQANLTSLFKEDFPKENTYGCRSVVAIECSIALGVNVGVHLKEDPELPIHELMVHSFATKLFGFITPPMTLWRFCKNTKSGITNKNKESPYPVLATQTIRGLTLLETLQSFPERLEQLDAQSVCEAIMLAMLINPEDGRADNYIIEPFLKGLQIAYRLVCIDNDHAFVRPVNFKNGVELTGPKSLQVKTILFCLNQMKGSLHESVLKRILSINPYDFLKEWIEGLQQSFEVIGKLFHETERNGFRGRNVHLTMAFKPSIILDIYQKLLRLQGVLQRISDLPLIEVLNEVIPCLGYRYGIAFHQFKEPLERFKFLTEGCFEKRLIVKMEEKSNRNVEPQYYLGTTSNANQVQEMMQDLVAEERKTEAEKEVPLSRILKQLKETHELQSKLKEIQNELQQGKTENFYKLHLIDQEKIINGQGTELPGIDFSLMKLADGKPNLRLQEQVLSSLVGVPFSKLKLRNIEALTDSILEKLTKGLKNSLRSLAIKNCPKLTLVGLVFVGSTCLNLKELKLRNLNIRYSKFYEKYPQLIQLYLEDLPVDFIQALDKMLEKCKISSRVGNNIPVEAINGLTEMVEFWRDSVMKITPMLLAKLKDENSNVRSTAAEALGKLSLRSEMQKAIIDILLPLLKDEDSDVRSAVAVALRKLSKTPEMQEVIIETMLPLLKDKNSDVRSAAANALGKLSLPPEMQKVVIDTLLPRLKEEDSDIRRDAADALGELSPPSEMQKAIIDTLLPLLKDKNSGVRSAAANALGKLSLPPEMQKVVIDTLLPRLKEEDSDIRRDAADALGELSPPSEMQKAIIDTLLPLLKDKNSDVRSVAAEALGKLSPPPKMQKVIIETMLPLLKHKFSYVRRAAARALGKLSPPPEMQKVIIETMLPLLKDRASDVRSAAAIALGKLSPPPEMQKVIIETMLPLLKHKFSYVRRAAANALGKLSLPPEMQKVVIDTLLPRLKEEDSDIRRDAAETLEKLSLPPEMQKAIIDTLLPLLKDKDSYVRRVATIALGELSLPPEMQKIVIDILLPLLKDRVSDVRGVAAIALGKLSPPPEVQKVIIETMLPLLEFLDIRRTAAIALGKLSPPPEVQKVIIETMLPLLKHEFLDIRSDAAETLARLPYTPETIKILKGVFFSELNKATFFQDEFFITSISISLAELCQVDRFVGYYATWFENTFSNKIQQEKSQPSSGIIAPQPSSIPHLSDSQEQQQQHHHHHDHHLQTHSPDPLSSSKLLPPKTPHSPGDSKGFGETYMLQQFALVSSASRVPSTPSRSQPLQDLSTATSPRERKEEKKGSTPADLAIALIHLDAIPSSSTQPLTGKDKRKL